MTIRNEQIAAGVVHGMPRDLLTVISADEAVLALWQGLTPLGRNEWICWIEDAKKAETRRSRIGRVRTGLLEGKRRPCCWPGCPHRKKSGKAVEI